MKDIKKIVKLDLSQQLIDNLIHAGYPFAAWKMPFSSEVQLIISLSGSSKISDFSIAESKAGFVINAYASNHPVHPYFIPADLVITKEAVRINPQVKDLNIDTLLESLSQSNNKSGKKLKKSRTHAADVFEVNVERAVDRIRKQHFHKVVLSRYKDEYLPQQFESWHFFEKICSAYPSAFCNLYFIPEKGLWIGATPEILISDNDKRFLTVALAGTKS
ncbi:MAG: chorismate-binding protein, partial [Bacteroidota bacterium]